MALDSRGTTFRNPVVLKTQPGVWEIACHGSAIIQMADIQPMRRKVAESWTGPGRGSMRHMEDQTVAALEAVRLARSMDPELTFDNWSVLACPVLPGRATFCDNLRRYAEEGAFAISPQVIPQCSLHSLPGQLSIILGAHGPNLGVGGWPGTEDQVWSTAWAIDKASNPEGHWLIWTCREADIPGHHGSTQVKALALAIRKPGPGSRSRWNAHLEWNSPAGIAWCPWKAAAFLEGTGSVGAFKAGGGAFGLRLVPSDRHS